MTETIPQETVKSGDYQLVIHRDGGNCRWSYYATYDEAVAAAVETTDDFAIREVLDVGHIGPKIVFGVGPAKKMRSGAISI